MLSILTNQSSILGKSLFDTSSEKWTASPSRETTLFESGSGHRLVQCQATYSPTHGLGEPDEAEEIWDQTSNFGLELESSNDGVYG